jgi:hypothetical protein
MGLLRCLRPVFCPKCRKPIGTLLSGGGYVYVLSSEAFPGTFKVGFTNRSVNDRVEELNSSTSLPSPFIAEMIFLSTSAREDEVSSHGSLSPFRVNDRREFFRISLEQLHDHLVCILRRKPIYYSETLSKSLDLRQQLEQKKQEERLQRETEHLKQKRQEEKTEQERKQRKQAQSLVQNAKIRSCAACGHTPETLLNTPRICPRCRAICFS